jgi:CRISPR-associated protein Csb2
MLSIVVRLRSGRYDADGDRPGEAEWPPAPSRVFCALTASAVQAPDWEALRWLEAAGVPEVWDPGEALRGQAESYVVTNQPSPKGGSQTWPGRTNGLRRRGFATPPADRFAIVWPEADVDDVTLKALHRMALRVPYVGRSTSLAEVSVGVESPESPPSGWRVWRPVEQRERGEAALAVPYAGYTAALESAYQRGDRAWEVARTHHYTLRPVQSSEPDEQMLRGPYSDLLVWGLTKPTTRIGSEQTVQLAQALRRAVLARTADPIPAQVSGHGADGRPHVAFVVLPHVGREHADGRVMGLGLAVPNDLPPAEWQALARGVMAPPLTSLTVRRNWPVLRLTQETGREWSLQAERWTAAPHGARRWVTATPLIADGRLRRGRTSEELVRRSLAKAGYPEPEEVETSTGPLLEGTPWRPAAGTLPESAGGFPLLHARVTFHRPLLGPLFAGKMRYLGLGLFVPQRKEKR